jgi:hypothetical protein
MKVVSLTCSICTGLAVIALSSACGSPEPAPEATAEARDQPQAAAAVVAEVQEAPQPFVLGAPPAGKAPDNPYSEAQIERGKYLVTAAMCNDCHTAWVFDPDLGIPRNEMSWMLAGHPKGAPKPSARPGPGDMGVIGPTFTSFALPFGIMYSANLTPDIDTGTGTWTEEMFLGIFRKGRHLGGDGRGVIPPMPWWWIRNLSDEDLVAIFAYLRSVPPIHNPVPEQEVPEEAVWPMRDGMDRWVATLPQQQWAAAKP